MSPTNLTRLVADPVLASIAMTDLSGPTKRIPQQVGIPLRLAMVVIAVAIGTATGRAADDPPPQPSAPPVISSHLNESAAGSPSGHLRTGAWSTPSPPAMSQLRSAGDLAGALRAAAMEPSQPAPTPPPSTPDPPRSALDPPPSAGRFAIDLYDKGDFVSQARADWCVPASILSMMNMIDADRIGQTPTQRKLDRLARSLSTPRLRGAGAEPEGWAASLDRLGLGPYEVRAERTRSAAITAAARALRLTGRPVGLLMWRGAHAWVMSGFRATADPAYTDHFSVTHIYVLDPWYPRVSSIWGPARPPGATVPVRRLAEDFLAWRRPAVRYPEKDGRFVLVVPVVDAPGGRNEAKP
jgi:hypothetical protein